MSRKGERNNATYIESLRLAQAGVSLDQALDFMEVRVSRSYEQGELDLREIENTVRSAYTKQVFKFPHEQGEDELHFAGLEERRSWSSLSSAKASITRNHYRPETYSGSGRGTSGGSGTGTHALVAVTLGNSILDSDTFNIDRREDRARLVKAAHGAFK